MPAYTGRFAPSPTGPLHAGSLVAALASWLDARAHGGRWLVRIEDVDTPRCVLGADELILRQLAACGLLPDEPPAWQSQRGGLYAAALAKLESAGAVYPCSCSRKDIEAALAARGIAPRRHGETVYPGTCRQGLGGNAPRAWRVRCGDEARPLSIGWHDRRLGVQAQDVTHEVGDFVVLRADGLWAYQLAVVVDDASQSITHVVRGEDLADNTPRQIHLQRLLGLPTPAYLHTPLVLGADGEKLSKQNGAEVLDVRDPLLALRSAAATLGLPVLPAQTRDAWLAEAVPAWAGMMRGFPRKDREPTMTTTPSGLQYEDTTPGTGSEARAGQHVQVHYTGWLHDPAAANGRGKKFDSSKDRGQTFGFQLGAGNVIRGWDEGVQGMKVGGTRVLQIPAELGYGARGAGGVIPPNATLVFEVELVAV